MEKLQKLVSEIVRKYDLEVSPELRYIDLESELGEVGKELLIGNDYGKREFTNTDNLESELGDTLFSLICLANTVDINLENALINAIKKYERRFNKSGSVGSEFDK